PSSWRRCLPSRPPRPRRTATLRRPLRRLQARSLASAGTMMRSRTSRVTRLRATVRTRAPCRRRALLRGRRRTGRGRRGVRMRSVWPRGESF
ncbi:hypothetical protein HK101_001590, partial [Irineochytrium annulatum]